MSHRRGWTWIGLGVALVGAPLAGQRPSAVEPVYYEFQVEKQAKPVVDGPWPTYPEVLRQSRISGRVLASFVVVTSGMADTTTFKVLETSHDLFGSAVRSNMARMRFTPALVGERKVKQLVQMPFTFSVP
jgi:TonB family protein